MILILIVLLLYICICMTVAVIMNKIRIILIQTKQTLKLEILDAITAAMWCLFYYLTHR